MFCESFNMDIFVKPRRRANFETYGTALDGDDDDCLLVLIQ
jgi:hypothetical protein